MLKSSFQLLVLLLAVPPFPPMLLMVCAATSLHCWLLRRDVPDLRCSSALSYRQTPLSRPLFDSLSQYSRGDLSANGAGSAPSVCQKFRLQIKDACQQNKILHANLRLRKAPVQLPMNSETMPC